MENTFQIEPLEIAKVISLTPKGYVKVFKNTKQHLPLDIDVANRYGVFCAEREQYLEQIHNFKVRKDDVWVITMPKCGTTWMLELVWMLVNNFDYDAAMELEQIDRCPFLEYVAINPSYNTIEEANNMRSPRVIKSHLPMHMLPKGLWAVKPKIVYVSRDPKDGIVSSYHFFNGLGVISASIEGFVNEAVNDRTIWGPFWPHVAEFWSLRTEPNIHFTSFERMKRDLKFEILRVSKLLEKSVSPEQLDKLAEHLSFDKMKDNKSCNNVKLIRSVQKRCGIAEKTLGLFLRKGEVGSYKEELSSDLIKSLDEWQQRSTKLYGITPEEIFLS